MRIPEDAGEEGMKIDIRISVLGAIYELCKPKPLLEDLPINFLSHIGLRVAGRWQHRK